MIVIICRNHISFLLNRFSVEYRFLFPFFFLILKKANQKMFTLRKLKAAGLNSQELLIVYKGYIRPLLEYAAPLWHPGLTKQQVDQVENIQKQVCKYILGRNYKSYTESLATLEMKTLHDRRVDICRDFAGKVLAFDRFSTWFTPPVQNSIMQLRRSHVVKPFWYKTERFKSSPLPRRKKHGSTMVNHG